MRQRMKTGLSILLGSVLLPASAFAQEPLVHEPFDAAQPGNTVIGTDGGQSSKGFEGAWLSHTGPDNDSATLVAEALEYRSGKHQLRTLGGRLIVQDRHIQRDLARPLPLDAGQTYWISFVCHLSQPSDEKAAVAVIQLAKRGFGSWVSIGDQHFEEGSQWSVWDGGPVSSSDKPMQGTQLVVLRIEAGADAKAPDTLHLWINPDLGSEPDQAQAVIKHDNRLNLSDIGHIKIIAEGQKLDLDEIRVGKSAESVMPVKPESEG